jgi:hypothetical protein
MNKQDFLKILQPDTKAVPLGDSQVWVSQWSLESSDRVIKAQAEYADEKITWNDFLTVVATCSICDETGDLVFDESDFDAVKKMGARKLKDVYLAALALNRIDAEESEESEKN